MPEARRCRESDRPLGKVGVTRAERGRVRFPVPRSRRRDAQARWAVAADLSRRPRRHRRRRTPHPPVLSHPYRAPSPDPGEPACGTLARPLPLHVGVGWMDPPRVRSLTSLAEVPWPPWVRLSRWRRWGGPAGRVPLAAVGGPPRGSASARSSALARLGGPRSSSLPAGGPVRAPARLAPSDAPSRRPCHASAPPARATCPGSPGDPGCSPHGGGASRRGGCRVASSHRGRQRPASSPSRTAAGAAPRPRVLLRSLRAAPGRRSRGAGSCHRKPAQPPAVLLVQSFGMRSVPRRVSMHAERGAGEGATCTARTPIAARQLSSPLSLASPEAVPSRATPRCGRRPHQMRALAPLRDRQEAAPRSSSWPARSVAAGSGTRDRPPPADPLIQSRVTP